MLTAVAVTGTTFSTPSASSVPSQLTIWSCTTTESNTTSNVQVEVIQEGGRNKSYAKRLRPTTVMTTEKPIKFQRLETSSLTKQPCDINELDLSFLGTDDDMKSKEHDHAGSESINLSSILSGLTKNLCQSTTNEQDSNKTRPTGALEEVHPSTSSTTPITPPRGSPIQAVISGGGLSTAPASELHFRQFLLLQLKALQKRHQRMITQSIATRSNQLTLIPSGLEGK